MIVLRGFGCLGWIEGKGGFCKFMMGLYIWNIECLDCTTFALWFHCFQDAFDPDSSA
jgi:hypothetical protein